MSIEVTTVTGSLDGVVEISATIETHGVKGEKGDTGATGASGVAGTAADLPSVPSGDLTSTNVQDALDELDSEKAPIDHVGSTGIAQHGAASGLDAGFMSPSDKTKLDGVATGATANDTDANLKNRANHTGAQTASTISDFNSAADARADAKIATHVGLADPHTQYATDTDLTAAQALKVSKAGDSMSGALTLTDLIGQGFIQFPPQNPTPSTPTSGFRMYSGSTGRIAFKGTAGIPWSLDYLGLTATRVFTFPDQTGTLMIDPATTVGDTLYRNGSNVTDRLGIGADAYIKRVVGGLPAWSAENLSQDFGDGSDLNVTISGAVTLSQNMYYNVLTIAAGALLNTGGYMIYCKVLDLTNAPAGSIFRNGNNGANSSTNVAGAAGVALAAAYLGGSSAGSAGAAGASNAGASSAAAGSGNPSNGGDGGNSGASGAGGTGAAAAAGAGGTASNYSHFGRFEFSFLRGGSLIIGGSGGDGGNSGGGDGANTSRGGGGGGSGGGVIAIFAAEIITGGSTPSGVIRSQGGNGGSQTAAPAGGSCGGASGAGGAGGGYVYIAYLKKTGAAVTSLIDCAGGTGGNGSNGSGTGVGGNGGMGGSGGKIQAFNATSATGTQVTGSAGVAGTAAVGLTGGAGGNGGACSLTL